MNYSLLEKKISQFRIELSQDGSSIAHEILKRTHSIARTFNQRDNGLHTMRGHVATAYSNILELKGRLQKIVLPEPPLFTRPGLSAATLVKCNILYEAHQNDIRLCIEAQKLLETVLKDFGVDLSSESSAIPTPTREGIEKDNDEEDISEGLSQIEQNADDVEEIVKKTKAELLPPIPVPELPPMPFFSHHPRRQSKQLNHCHQSYNETIYDGSTLLGK